MAEDQVPNPQESQEDKSGKIQKRFNKNLEKLNALFNGDMSVFKTPRVPNDNVSTLVEELLKDRQKEALDKFKIKLSNLIEKKIEFDKVVSNMRRELEKSIEKKMEEFTKEMEDTFSIVENIDKLAGEYAGVLKHTQNIPPAP